MRFGYTGAVGSRGCGPGGSITSGRTANGSSNVNRWLGGVVPTFAWAGVQRIASSVSKKMPHRAPLCVPECTRDQPSFVPRFPMAAEPSPSEGDHRRKGCGSESLNNYSCFPGLEKFGARPAIHQARLTLCSRYAGDRGGEPEIPRIPHAESWGGERGAKSKVKAVLL